MASTRTACSSGAPTRSSARSMASRCAWSWARNPSLLIRRRAAVLEQVEFCDHAPEPLSLWTDGPNLSLLIAEPLRAPRAGEQRDRIVKELSQVVEDLTQRPHLRLQLRRLDPVQLAPHGAVAAHERAAVGRDLGERQVVADRAQQFLDVVLAVQTLPGETAESLQVIRERSLWRRRHLRPYETFRDRHTETVGTADPAVKRVCLDGVMEMVELGPLTAEQKAELEGD